MRTVSVVRGYVSKSRIRRKQNQRIFGKLSIKGYSGSYRSKGIREAVADMRTISVVRGYVSKSRIRRKQNQRIFGKLSIKGYSGSCRRYENCFSRTRLRKYQKEAESKDVREAVADMRTVLAVRGYVSKSRIRSCRLKDIREAIDQRIFGKLSQI